MSRSASWPAPALVITSGGCVTIQRATISCPSTVMIQPGSRRMSPPRLKVASRTGTSGSSKGGMRPRGQCSWINGTNARLSVQMAVNRCGASTWTSVTMPAPAAL